MAKLHASHQELKSDVDKKRIGFRKLKEGLQRQLDTAKKDMLARHERLAELEREIATLRKAHAETNSLRDVVSQLQSRNASLEEEHRRTEDGIEAKRHEVGQLEEAVRVGRTRLTELDREVRLTHDQQEAADAELARLSADQDRAQCQLSGVQAVHDELTSARQETKDMVAQAADHRAALANDEAELEKLNRARSKLTRATQELAAEAKRRMTGLSKDYLRVETLNIELCAQRDAARQLAGGAGRGAASRSDAALIRAIDEKERAERTVGDRGRQLSEERVKTAALMDELRGVEEDIGRGEGGSTMAALEARVAAADTRVGLAQEKARRVDGEVAELRGQTADLTESLAHAQADAAVYRGEIETRQKETAALEAEMRSLDGEIGRLHQAIDEGEGRQGVLARDRDERRELMRGIDLLIGDG